MATGAAAIERLLHSTELKNWLTGLTPQGHAAMVSPLEPSHEVAYPIYRDLAAKHVLITGGAQGIGLAVSRASCTRTSRGNASALRVLHFCIYLCYCVHAH